MKQHAKKHLKIINKLTHLSDYEIIEYFDFDNMKIKEKDFCPLYKKNQKCHEIEQLNCYSCGCPYFRLNNNDDKILSYCSINHKNGRTIESTTGIHQDCTNCTIPHKVNFIKANFNKNWNEIMRKVSHENT